MITNPTYHITSEDLSVMEISRVLELLVGVLLIWINALSSRKSILSE